MFKRLAQLISSLLGVRVEKYEKLRIAVQEKDTSISREIVKEVFKFHRAVHPFYGNDVPEQLKIGGGWKGDIETRRTQQLQLINRNDANNYISLLKNMFFNELVSGLWNYHYFGEAYNLHPKFLRDLEHFETVTGRDMLDLAKKDPWKRWGLETSAGIIDYASPLHGLQAQNILNLTNSFNDEEIILVDLGSGFGGMVDYIVKWSQKRLSVVLIDIPVNLSTAYAYLANIHGSENARIISNLEDLEYHFSANAYKEVLFTLLPTTLFKRFCEIKKVNIVNNVHSFSEMDFETVKYYLEIITSNKPNFIVETNAESSGKLKFGLNEVSVFAFQTEINKKYELLARFSESPLSRYLTSIYAPK